jgi:hypothetical protein
MYGFSGGVTDTRDGWLSRVPRDEEIAAHDREANNDPHRKARL